MWLCTTHGFFSVVKATGESPDKGKLLIRARWKAHLQNLVALAPEGALGEIRTTANTDYPYRLVVDEATFAPVLLQLLSSITYGNFKSAVATEMRRGHVGADYEHALHDVWSVFFQAAKFARVPQRPWSLRDADVDVQFRQEWPDAALFGRAKPVCRWCTTPVLVDGELCPECERERAELNRKAELDKKKTKKPVRRSK